MTSDQYAAACQREIEAAQAVCGKDAPQAQLVGHLAGEVVRLRAALAAQIAGHQLTSKEASESAVLRAENRKLTERVKELKNTAAEAITTLQNAAGF